MAWKETTAMEQKIEFITEWRSGAYSITELCRQFGISRPTAYKYIDRFEKEGLQGLFEMWGAEKIWKLMQHSHRKSQVPSISTINRILKRPLAANAPYLDAIFWIEDGKNWLGSVLSFSGYYQFIWLYGEKYEPTKKEFEQVNEPDRQTGQTLNRLYGAKWFAIVQDLNMPAQLAARL